MAWELHLYVTPSGQPVVQKFIGSLEKAARAKITREIELLEEYGVELGMPHTKAMGNGLVELRARGKQEVRILYVFASGLNIYLLHGFVKKTKTTPKKEIEDS